MTIDLNNWTAADEHEIEGYDDFVPPKYSDPGEVLIYWNPRPYNICWKADVVVLDCDPNSSVWWMMEGGGIEYWMRELLDLELEGYYVVSGIHGAYHKGDGYSTDDSEEWHFKLCQRASHDQVINCALDGVGYRGDEFDE
jgi:hypothetical protein